MLQLGISTRKSGWQLRVPGEIKTVFRGWLFSKGERGWALQRGLLEEERGWDLCVPPPSWPEGSGAWPRADKCMELDVIYSYRRQRGERTCDGEVRRAVRGGREEQREFSLRILGFCKAGKMPFFSTEFVLKPCGRRALKNSCLRRGKGGSESPDFRRPGAADPGCPNPDPWSLRGAAQDGRCRVNWRHRDAGRARGEEERGDLAALG